LLPGSTKFTDVRDDINETTRSWFHFCEDRVREQRRLLEPSQATWERAATAWIGQAVRYFHFVNVAPGTEEGAYEGQGRYAYGSREVTSVVQGVRMQLTIHGGIIFDLLLDNPNQPGDTIWTTVDHMIVDGRSVANLWSSRESG